MYAMPVDFQLTWFINRLQRWLNTREKIQEINSIDDVVDLINKSNRIIVLTGAGVLI